MIALFLNKLMEEDLQQSVGLLSGYLSTGDIANLDIISKCVDTINNINPDIFNDEFVEGILGGLNTILEASFETGDINIISKCVDTINNINPDIFDIDPFNQYIQPLIEALKAYLINSGDIATNLDNISKCVDIITNFISIMNDEYVIQYINDLKEISDLLIGNDKLILRGLDIIFEIISNDCGNIEYINEILNQSLFPIITRDGITFDAILKSINICIIVFELDIVLKDGEKEGIQESIRAYLNQCIDNVISAMSEMNETENYDDILKCLDIIIMISYNDIDLVFEHFGENMELFGSLLEIDDVVIQLKCLDIIMAIARNYGIGDDINVEGFLDNVISILHDDDLNYNGINIVLKYLDIILLSITQNNAQSIENNIVSIIGDITNENYENMKNILLVCLDILNDILDKYDITDDDRSVCAGLVLTDDEILKDPDVVSKVLEISNKVVEIYNDENILEKFNQIMEYYIQQNPNMNVISSCIDIITNAGFPDGPKQACLTFLYENFDTLVNSVIVLEDNYIMYFDIIQLIVFRNKELYDIQPHISQSVINSISKIDQDNVLRCLDIIIIILYNATDVVTEQFEPIIGKVLELLGIDNFDIRSKCLDIMAAITSSVSIVHRNLLEPIYETLIATFEPINETLVQIQGILSETLEQIQEMYQTYTNIISKGLYILVLLAYDGLNYPEYLLTINDKEIIIDFLKLLTDVRIRNNGDIKQVIIPIILEYGSNLPQEDNYQTPYIFIQIVRTFTVLCGRYDQTTNIYSFDDEGISSFIYNDGVKELIESVHSGFYEYSHLIPSQT